MRMHNMATRLDRPDQTINRLGRRNQLVDTGPREPPRPSTESRKMWLNAGGVCMLYSLQVARTRSPLHATVIVGLDATAAGMTCPDDDEISLWDSKTQSHVGVLGRCSHFSSFRRLHCKCTAPPEPWRCYCSKEVWSLVP